MKVIIAFFATAVFAITASNALIAQYFDVTPNAECKSPKLVLQLEQSTKEACMARCHQIPKCFSGQFSKGQCKLQAAYCKKPVPSPGSYFFSRRGFRKCSMCQSGYLCPRINNVCYTTGFCASNVRPNSRAPVRGPIRQGCDCDPSDPSMPFCCDYENCNCVGSHCRHLKRTKTRTPYKNIYMMQDIIYRKVHNGKGMKNDLAVKSGYAAALPSFLRGRSFDRKKVKKVPTFGARPSWGSK